MGRGCCFRNRGGEASAEVWVRTRNQNLHKQQKWLRKLLQNPRVEWSCWAGGRASRGGQREVVWATRLLRLQAVGLGSYGHRPRDASCLLSFFKSSLTLSSVATNVSLRGCHLPCVSQSPGASVGGPEQWGLKPPERGICRLRSPAFCMSWRPSAWAGGPLRAPALSRACRGPKVGEAQTPSAACSALSPLPSAASPGAGEASGKQKQEVCLPDSSWAPQPSGAQEHWGLALSLELELGLGADDHTDSFRGLPWLQCEAVSSRGRNHQDNAGVTMSEWGWGGGGRLPSGGESLHSPASSISPRSTRRTGGPSLLISALRALISEARWQSCSCLHPASMTSK